MKDKAEAFTIRVLEIDQASISVEEFNKVDKRQYSHHDKANPDLAQAYAGLAKLGQS
jgi:hypothetical protein